VAVLPPPGVRLARWGGLSALSVGAGAALLGVRSDLVAMLGRGAFVREGALVLATSVAGAAAALAWAVPGAAQARSLRRAGLALLAGWGGLIVWRLAAAGAPLAQLAGEPSHAACVLRVVALGLVPVLALFAMVRRAAPLEPAWTGALVALGGFAAASVGVQATCPLDSAAHALIWHVAPVAALILAGAAAGRLLRT